MSTMGERIKESREKKGIYQARLAEMIGVKSAGVISNWEKDINKPDSDKIIRLCHALDVLPSYLLDYYGESSDELNKEEKEHIKKYRVLDERGKEAVDSILDVEYKYVLEMQKRSRQQEEVEKIITLPLPLQSASAGTGQFTDDESAEDIAVIYNEHTAKADYIMRVSGDSMEPKFYDGDLVLVRDQPAVEVGEIGIFVINGDQYIKEYKGDYLHSLNPDWDDVDCTEDTYCRGKVIGVLDEDWIR